MKKRLSLSLTLGAIALASFAPAQEASSEAAAKTKTSPAAEEAPEKMWNIGTVSMFTDTLRADTIAWGTIVGIDKTKGLPRVVFKPDTLIHGAPIAEEQVSLVTNSNAVLDAYIGQRATCAIIRGHDGVTYGLAHGLQSMTPEHLQPDVSEAFYREFLAINADYAGTLQELLAVNPADGNFGFPPELVRRWIDTLITYAGKTGSQAAHHACRELMQGTTFARMLNHADLATLAEAASASAPGTYDRGYLYIILRTYGKALVPLDQVMDNLRDETALLNVDHMTSYLWLLNQEQAVVDAVVRVINDIEGETPLARRNAVSVAGNFRSKKALPALRARLGHETDRNIKRELLNSFRANPDPDNFGPLLNYLNGGDAKNLTGVNTDCKDSANLFKRALVAIAVIDSELSNAMIYDAYQRAKKQWVTDFLRPLLKTNSEMRPRVEILDEDDVPLALVPDRPDLKKAE